MLLFSPQICILLPNSVVGKCPKTSDANKIIQINLYDIRLYDKTLSQKRSGHSRLQPSCSQSPLPQYENIRGWHVCCGGLCSSHLEIPEDESCRCKYQILWHSRCDASTVLLFAAWWPAPSVPLCRCRHSALSDSCSFTSPTQFIFSLSPCLMLPFIISAGFIIRTVTLVLHLYLHSIANIFYLSLDAKTFMILQSSWSMCLSKWTLIVP